MLNFKDKNNERTVISMEGKELTHNNAARDVEEFSGKAPPRSGKCFSNVSLIASVSALILMTIFFFSFIVPKNMDSFKTDGGIFGSVSSFLVNKALKFGFYVPDNNDNGLNGVAGDNTDDSEDSVSEPPTDFVTEPGSEKPTEEESGGVYETGSENCSDTEAQATDGESEFPSETESQSGSHEEISGQYIPVADADLSEFEKGVYYINNNTLYRPDTEYLAGKDIPYMYNKGSEYPLVLVLHTHTCEAYSADGKKVFLSNEGIKSPYGTETVVAAGEQTVNILNLNGVPAVHCTVIHDGDSNVDSYKRAEQTIEWMLQMYPSIKYIIDIHRSSEMDEDGNIIRTESYTGAQECAQLRITVSAGEQSEWEDNLSLALKLRQKINGDNLRICRPVALSGSEFNSKHSYYYLTVDMGSCGNTLDEALAAAEIFGDALSDIIKYGR